MTRRTGYAAVIGLGAGIAGIASVWVGVDLFSVVVLVVAALVVVIAGVLAVRQFAALALLLLVVRPELDAVGHGSAIAIGLIFIAASVWWLWSQWRTDQLRRPSVAVWALLGFVGAAALSTLSSHVPALSAASAARLTAGVLMFVVIEQLVRSRQLTSSAVHRALAASAVIVCGHVIVQVITGTSPVDSDTGLSRVTGPFVHPSVLGKYAAVLCVLMLARLVWSRSGQRLLWGCGTLATGVVVLLTYTRAAWIAVALGAFVIAYRRDRRWLPVVIAVCVVVVALTPSLNQRVVDIWDPPPPPPGAPESSLAWRWGYWQALAPLGWLNPLTGIGFGVVPTMRSEGLLPHNVWVQTWVELGAVGMVALVAVTIGVTVTLREAGRALRQREGEARAAFEAAAAVALGLVTVTLTENLLDETTTLWVAGAVIATGWSVSPDPPHAAADWWLGRSGWRARRSRHARGVPSQR